MTPLARLRTGAVHALAAVGALSLACVAYVHVEMWRETHARPLISAPSAISPVAEKLAARVAPGLQEAARAYQPTFVQNAGGPVNRLAAGLVYPVVVREIPRGTAIGCDHILTHFGRLSLAELVGLVVDHAAAKGERVHESLLYFGR